MGRKSPIDHHLETIHRLNSLGYERVEIARQIGVSKHALQAYLQRRGIQPIQMPGKALLRREAEVRDLVERQRLTHEQAAQVLGVHPSTVERFCGALGLRTARTGPRASEHHPDWGSGRHLAKHWYVDVHAPLHPHAKNSGYVPEHRLVQEVVLGRYLRAGEVVDHVDGHVQHNWPDNLRLFATNADHLRETLSGREKASRIRSIFGDWRSNRDNRRCPAPDETLALCPSEIRAALDRHIEIHRPTTEHAHLPRKTLLRSGPWTPAFRSTTTG